MSTLTPRMNLKRPDDTDPFLTQDFSDNYDVLDAAPGTHICTSTTRPSWGAAQAGRTVFLTDWKCFQYWSGSAWLDERAATGLFSGGAVFDATLSKNTVAVYNLVNFTTPRSCSLAIMMNITASCDERFTQSLFGRIVFDGSDVLMGGYSDALRFTGDAGSGTAQASMTLPMLGVVNVSAGAHTIGGKVTVGAYNSSLIIRGMKTVAVLGIHASNQIL